MHGEISSIGRCCPTRDFLLTQGRDICDGPPWSAMKGVQQRMPRLGISVRRLLRSYRTLTTRVTKGFQRQ